MLACWRSSLIPMRVLAAVRVVASAREAGRPGSRVRAARLTGRGSRSSSGVSLIRDTVAQQMLRRGTGRVPGVDLALRLGQDAPHVAAEPRVAGVPGLPRPGIGRELAQGDAQRRDPVEA